MLADASLFHRFTDTKVYLTSSVKIWNKSPQNIRRYTDIFLQCRVAATVYVARVSVCAAVVSTAYSAPCIDEAEYCDEYVCLSVCTVSGITHPNLTQNSVHVSPMVGPSLAALQYVMYFRFCGGNRRCERKYMFI